MLIFVIGGVLLEEGESRWRRWYQRMILWEDCGIEEDGWAVCVREQALGNLVRLSGASSEVGVGVARCEGPR